jgi:hypothetical protein
VAGHHLMAYILRRGWLALHAGDTTAGEKRHAPRGVVLDGAPYSFISFPWIQPFAMPRPLC